MRILWPALLVVPALALAPTAGGAQIGIPLTGEFRGGLATPTGDWNDDGGLEGGYGFGANLQVHFSPGVRVYVGSLEADAEARDRGVRAGLAANFPAVLGEAAPFVTAGLVFNRANLDLGEGRRLESDIGVGYEAGLGLDLPLSGVVRFTPLVRYTSHQARFEEFGVLGDEEFEAAHWKFDLGVALVLR